MKPEELKIFFTAKEARNFEVVDFSLKDKNLKGSSANWNKGTFRHFSPLEMMELNGKVVSIARMVNPFKYNENSYGYFDGIETAIAAFELGYIDYFEIANISSFPLMKGYLAIDDIDREPLQEKTKKIYKEFFDIYYNQNGNDFKYGILCLNTKNILKKKFVDFKKAFENMFDLLEKGKGESLFEEEKYFLSLLSAKVAYYDFNDSEKSTSILFDSFQHAEDYHKNILNPIFANCYFDTVPVSEVFQREIERFVERTNKEGK